MSEGWLARNATSGWAFPGEMASPQRATWSLEDLLEILSRDKNYTTALLKLKREGTSGEPLVRDPLYIVLPITLLYALIFLGGLVGNVSTCVVIARNKSMHTATNYYLFSLAVSDLLLLVSGLPPELCFIWSRFPYAFGEAFCVVTSFAAETSANATVLTITAFTVERYVAICHPFVSHTMSRLSRAVKLIVAIWLLAICLAVPQAIQYGVTYMPGSDASSHPERTVCSIKWKYTEHVFEISTMLFFALPMSVITVLYVLIGVKLRGSRLLQASLNAPRPAGSFAHGDAGRGRSVAQRNVVRMLVAVVVAFFICWAPFHAQRLIADWASRNVTSPHSPLIKIYFALTYVSGVFYYLSTTINPLLYSIMSNKFREAFKSMLSQHCGRKWSPRGLSPRRATYSSLSRWPRSSAARRAGSGSLSVSEESQRASGVAHHFRSQNGARGREASEQRELPLWPGEAGPAARSGGHPAGSCGLARSVREPPLREGDETPRGTGARRKITLGLLAGRLGFGGSGPSKGEDGSTKVRRKLAAEVGSAVPTRLQSQASIDSANTISNSSLQDLDQTEFVGSELAHVMGQLNLHLVP